MKFLILSLMFTTGFVFARAHSTVDRQPITANRQLATDTINRSAFYKAMQSNDRVVINAQLTDLKSLTPKNAKDAFMGAMIMKSAGVGGNPASKLKLFKEGHTMLEAAIKEAPDNAEYRFLRLMIQEHAPGILGYKDDEEKDSAYIRKSYKSLPANLQQIITDYSKKSKILKLDVS